MAEGLSTPVFTVGQEIAAFRASCKILSKAWEESRLASNSEGFSLNEYEGVAYDAFPSFHNIEDFIVQESDIQTNGNVNYLQKWMEAKEKTRSSRRQRPGKCNKDGKRSRGCNKDGKRSQHFSRCFLGRKQLHDVVGRMEGI